MEYFTLNIGKTVDLDILNIAVFTLLFSMNESFLFFRNAVYSRYTCTDWDASNKANFHLSDRERASAERLRAEAWRAVKSTDSRTRNRQASNTKRLGMFK